MADTSSNSGVHAPPPPPPPRLPASLSSLSNTRQRARLGRPSDAGKGAALAQVERTAIVSRHHTYKKPSRAPSWRAAVIVLIAGAVVGYTLIRSLLP